MSQLEITELLKANPKGLTVNELVKMTGHHRGTIHNNLRDMKKWRELDWTDEHGPRYTLRVIAE